MKKSLIIVFCGVVAAIFVLTTYTNIAHAETSRHVQLMLEGKYENPEVPAQIFENRTFVPIRFISENMGASVYWDEQAQRIQISKGASTVELFVNQKQIVLNGQAYEMDVAPFIMDERTMVPIRFVSEYLGLRVGWEATQRMAIISNPVDLILNGTVIGGKYQPINVYGDLYIPIFHLAQLTNVTVTDQEDGQAYAFTNNVRNQVASFSALAEDDQSVAADDHIHQHDHIEQSADDESKWDQQQYSEQAAGHVKHTDTSVQVSAVKVLPASEIITIDQVRMVRWEWANELLGADITYDPTSARIIINKEIKVTELTDIRYENGKYVLSLSAQAEGHVQHFFLQDPLRLVVDIPNVRLSEMLRPAHGNTSTILPYGFGTVNQVRVSQFSVDPLTVRVVFDLNQRSSVNVEMREQEIILHVEERRPLVVIDPGHGGRDPGASGQFSTEKQVVLDISLKIIQFLRNDPDIDVLATRETDVYLTLDERAEMANGAQADLFLSVHANASTSKTAGGTETYIFPNVDRTFGQIVHKHLMQATQLQDRGLKQANFKVLRLTNMPAALIEIAFISNASEEVLLNDPTFQDRVAQSMYNAIREYLYGK